MPVMKFNDGGTVRICITEVVLMHFKEWNKDDFLLLECVHYLTLTFQIKLLCKIANNKAAIRGNSL